MAQPPAQPGAVLIPHDGVFSPLNLSGLVAAACSVGLPLLSGLGDGWPGPRLAAYLAAALAYLLLVAGYLSSRRLASWYGRRLRAYLAAAGLSALGTLAASGDLYIQPLAFSVPFVIAVIGLGRRGAAGVGVAYLGLIGLGLSLGGLRSAEQLLVALAIYGSVLLFMYASVRLSLEQAAARETAARLAAALARERDALAALAAENARLAGEAAGAATLAERNRIARELHDSIAQGLTAVSMQIEAAQRAIERDPERARARLGRAAALARETLGEVRRSVWDLAAPELEGPQLAAALAEQAARLRERTGLDVRYEHHGPPLDLPSARGAQVLRIVQEALQNVEKHAGASTVQVGSRRDEAGQRFWVRDNGRGFDPASPPPPGDGGGFGLPSLSERARLAGGELSVASNPGAGTTVSVLIRP